MKKILFGMMACAALCACTSDDLLGVADSGGAANGEGVAYLTVRIKDVNSGTRASIGSLAYGTEAEQAVNNAYFYLYDETDNYYAYGSLGAVTGTASTDDPATNIEWGSDAQVAIWGLTDPSVPKKMVTVLNQPDGFTGVNMNLGEMTAALAGTPYFAGRYFVMSTSVYYDNDVVNYTELSEDDFTLEPINTGVDYPAAQNGGTTAVDVYVERLAAKVGVNVSENLGEEIDLTSALAAAFPNGEPDGGVHVQLLGFGVDGVARDAYLVKDIADNNQWNGLTFVWNDASDYRTYWAESPNYGVEQEYPTSSNGNTATDENNSSACLNPYLRYVSLRDNTRNIDGSGTNELTALGSTTYCGENTNTVGTDGVIADATSNGLTNVLVKAQVMTQGDDEELVPLDLVEYHGEYYTAADFCQKTVEDVVDYDFTIVVDEVIAAMKENDTYSAVASYLDDLNAAIIKDNIYVSEANSSHKYGIGVSAPSSVTAFGGEMLSLYNAYDGNVRIFYNGAQPYWGENGDGTAVGSEIIGKYPASDIVYGGADLGDYDFWFHIDSSQLGTLENMGLTALGLLYQIPSGSGDYYMPIDNSISFTTVATGDDNYTGGHVYTTRNYLLRTITVEADGIDTEFGSLYPNYYKDGLMYYHVPIEHLGTGASGFAEGDYGVVRNHWYNVTVTDIANLGRGIAVESEVIVPQPEVDYYYLGADIDILSWQMVDQNVAW